MKIISFRSMPLPLLILFVFLGFLQIGCSPRERAVDNSVQQYSGPFIEQGYYQFSEGALDQPVPAIGITVKDGQTSVYGLLSYTCGNRAFAIYGITRLIFSEAPIIEATGPNYSSQSHQCTISTQIVPESASAIRIVLTINDVLQEPYILTKVSKVEFVEHLKKVISRADEFSGFENDCQNSLEMSCDGLK